MISKIFSDEFLSNSCFKNYIIAVAVLQTKKFLYFSKTEELCLPGMGSHSNLLIIYKY